MKRISFLVIAAATQLAQAQVASPLVTQDNLQQTICNTQYVVGNKAPMTYSRAVRPPVSYTNAVKVQLFQKRPAAVIAADTKILGRDPVIKDYELDHWIPIADGGHPRDPKNLKLQLWMGTNGAKKKDVVEAEVHRRLCAGTMTLQDSMACWKDNNWKFCLNQR